MTTIVLRDGSVFRFIALSDETLMHGNVLSREGVKVERGE